jgi:phytoene/squalene synthetase
MKDSLARAISITKAASRQTYYTIRYLVDRNLVADAYRSYGYFRWLDDLIDTSPRQASDKLAILYRQQVILNSCYRGEIPDDLCPEEWMLADLISHDTEKNSGLQVYLRNMMDVIGFDAGRCGKFISQGELTEYSQKLALAVTEALHYFLGHENPSPPHPARYLAVTAAHIVHMLRDTVEDGEAGYYNIPGEYLELRGISPQDVTNEAYREWVWARGHLAREYFEKSHDCTAKVRNWRCRLAGFAYTAQFEWMLNVIERDNYFLREKYPERKRLRAGLSMAWSTLRSLFAAL